jgi:hypothetical protein
MIHRVKWYARATRGLGAGAGGGKRGSASGIDVAPTGALLKPLIIAPLRGPKRRRGLL